MRGQAPTGSPPSPTSSTLSLPWATRSFDTLQSGPGSGSCRVETSAPSASVSRLVPSSTRSPACLYLSPCVSGSPSPCLSACVSPCVTHTITSPDCAACPQSLPSPASLQLPSGLSLGPPSSDGKRMAMGPSGPPPSGEWRGRPGLSPVCVRWLAAPRTLTAPLGALVSSLDISGSTVAGGGPAWMCLVCRSLSVWELLAIMAVNWVPADAEVMRLVPA